ncbi:beta-ketoacyl synthase N-terminal-like domain-containing protein [Winogradskyella immobilis]|uniref:Beta-ketoacyl synthase n=1 Tax=Winogradskyella immobilis TaxID=2816852 RepID=A0ABS8EQW8_9FLAO|nr:beta-ketoacyl synthase N-terminal-like domain-containing protein [Winogradskyella immobilis]MCC1485276.1 beta-ketoacyl synthase [Winogradskyella immobilis]MCG0017368.1 beta-ketoacyl synthase [Winogradskyella immobilis]
MNQPISITAISSISPLGFQSESIWRNYRSNRHFFSEINGDLVAQLSEEAKQDIAKLRNSNSKYKQLDDSVLYGIYAARKAVQQAGWQAEDNFGINVGSSRGATGLFETYFKDFLDKNKAKPLSSPTTTLGNISSWIAHDLQTKGPEISHSITCSTALHSMLNGVAWLQSGLSDKFLVGGSEAPLTPFTIAQMKALKIYCHSEQSEESYPCKALDFNKTKNTMILSEAAAMACLELGKKEHALAFIEGIGYGTEPLEHNASLSTNADCFQRSMTMALGKLKPDDIDIIVTHTPGTVKGDLAEYNAIKQIFCNKIPALTTNKLKVGHSLGASGLLSIEMAVLMLNHQTFIDIPYLEQSHPKKISKIMINAVGFGGNAVTILLSK